MSREKKYKYFEAYKYPIDYYDYKYFDEDPKADPYENRTYNFNNKKIKRNEPLAIEQINEKYEPYLYMYESNDIENHQQYPVNKDIKEFYIRKSNDNNYKNYIDLTNFIDLTSDYDDDDKKILEEYLKPNHEFKNLITDLHKIDTKYYYTDVYLLRSDPSIGFREALSNYTVLETTHANAIYIDFKLHELHYFEPHGKKEESYMYDFLGKRNYPEEGLHHYRVKNILYAICKEFNLKLLIHKNIKQVSAPNCQIFCFWYVLAKTLNYTFDEIENHNMNDEKSYNLANNFKLSTNGENSTNTYIRYINFIERYRKKCLFANFNISNFEKEDEIIEFIKIEKVMMKRKKFRDADRVIIPMTIMFFEDPFLNVLFDDFQRDESNNSTNRIDNFNQYIIHKANSYKLLDPIDAIKRRTLRRSRIYRSRTFEKIPFAEREKLHRNYYDAQDQEYATRKRYAENLIKVEQEEEEEKKQLKEEKKMLDDDDDDDTVSDIGDQRFNYFYADGFYDPTGGKNHGDNDDNDEDDNKTISDYGDQEVIL